MASRSEASRICSAEISVRLDKRGHMVMNEPTVLAARFGLSYRYVLKLIAEERERMRRGRRQRTT